jgi:proteasome lid subunit RPN8/RPN11
LSTPFRLEIPGSLYQEIVRQALTERPNECCGLLAGKLLQPEPSSIIVGRVERRFPLTNVKADPRRYEIDPKGMLAAMRVMRDEGLQELAFYHSHPTSEPLPSKSDLAENGYGDSVIHLIVSLTSDPPLVRGWWLREDSFREAEFLVCEG